MKKLLALLALVASSVFADTTGNLITSGTSHTWYGVTTGALPANYMPGGPTPIYDPSTNMITFSYNANASVGQTLAINQALASVGAGVKINGYTYSYDVRSMNGDNRQGGTDTFTVSQLLRGPQNSVLLSSSQYYNTKFEWQTVTGTRTASTPYNIADTSYMQFGVQGGDNGYWGGYFGPQIRNVDMRLNYTIDPCFTNPAYSPTCPNYNTVSTSGNLFTGTTGAQSYAINTALSAAGAGATIHGFDYGYDYRAAARSCAIWNLFGVCLSGWNYSDASVNTTLTNSAGVTGFTETNNHNGGDNGVSGSYARSLRLNASVPMATLGTFSMTPSTNGDASITGMFSRAVYTADPCVSNPLSSTSCPNYAQAYHDQQCSINPLYASTCPGYTVAYTTQQCNANPLYNQSCPGYAAAYQTQQCSLNALYSSQCPGYEQAYLTQQCNINQLYSNQCPGYQQAYLTQQCNISQLYSNQCSGYQQAYQTQQCSLNALYASDCPGYASAYLSQQCTINSLYSNQCPGYAVAYKNQQCSLNALYATDCPGYAVAYHTAQCSANPLYMSDCLGYQAAYLNQQCNISQLYSTQCPGYQTAYFNQQCSLNGLYDRTCPNYATAYAAKQVLSTPTVVATTTTSEPAKVSVVSPTVESVLNVPSTTSATSPTSVTSVIAPAPSPAVSATTTSTTTTAAPAPAATSTEQKKTDTAVGSIEKKSTNSADARKQAADKAKEVATAAGNAKSLEDQAATQGLLVGLIGYVPGFNAYQNSLIPDTNALAMVRQYGKPVVDNRSAQRRLTGASDSRWQEMVDSQYQLGK